VTRTLNDGTAAALAGRLHASERSRQQIGHFTAEFPAMTIADAYAVQRAWVAEKCASGRHIIGHKIGLTSRAMQRAANIEEPDYGALLDDMVLPPGRDAPFGRFIEPRIEVELAFITKSALRGPGVTLFDVLNATDFVIPALEIIDARIRRTDAATGAPRQVRDTIADNAANAAIVCGGRPVRPDAIDLRWACALLYRNGVVEESGVAAAVLNHPAEGVAWLANKLALHGECLQAGEIVLSGSFTAPVPIQQGDTFHADYGPLGSIALRFA
jgi:2-oxo-hept-3-ene-1,7-dioate hydratase